MASPGQKRGGCGHLMAAFDSHSFCAQCYNKGKGSDPCITKQECAFCNVLTSEQLTQLATHSDKIKNEN